MVRSIQAHGLLSSASHWRGPTLIRCAHAYAAGAAIVVKRVLEMRNPDGLIMRPPMNRHENPSLGPDFLGVFLICAHDNLERRRNGLPGDWGFRLNLGTHVRGIQACPIYPPARLLLGGGTSTTPYCPRTVVFWEGGKPRKRRGFISIACPASTILFVVLARSGAADCEYLRFQPPGRTRAEVEFAGLPSVQKWRPCWAKLESRPTLRHDGPEHVLCFCTGRSGK